jgi:pimeloyl-ACP methyl ester carboxylesterase
MARSLASRHTSLEEPRQRLPPGHAADVDGAGDVFYRDAPPLGPQRGTVLLLHGWMVPSDPHWFRTFVVLQEAGWRVLAIDAGGHGRGLRPASAFRIEDCAEDAAALLRHLDAEPVVVLGYSMGGMVAQVLARRHPDLVAGVVLAATACEFRTSLVLRNAWLLMGVFQWWLRLAPRWTWDAVVRSVVRGDRETIDWAVGELRRGAAWDIAEAGREIGRFDSRGWVGELVPPSAVLLTTRDFLVPPPRQRDLARRLGAPVVTLESDHLAPATTPRRFHRALEQAIALAAPHISEAPRRRRRGSRGTARRMS